MKKMTFNYFNSVYTAEEQYEYFAPIVKRWAKLFNNPIRSRGAVRLWRWSSMSFSSCNCAGKVFRDAGYAPFEGFPLVKS